MSHYKHLSIEERENLYLGINQEKSIRAIAEELGRSPSTISRELKRGKRGKSGHRKYRPSVAQYRYERRRKNCGRKPILSDDASRKLIQEKLCDEWSPEQIQYRLKLEEDPVQVSYATIYRALNSGLIDEERPRYIHKCDRYSFHLRRKGKRRKKNGSVNKQGKYVIEHRISERPEAAEKRLEFGHWEGDTIIGKKGGARLTTMADRKGRFLLAAKTPNGTAEAVRDSIIHMFRQIPAEKIRSITPDRGHEFAKYAEVSDALHGVPFYFADPYSPWQRGTNENTNGLLRQYFPKGTSFDDISDEMLDAIVLKINLRPRKCLGWRSPFEVFFDTVLHLT